MKVRLSLGLLVAGLMATASPAFAQTGVAGKWVGELAAKDGHGVAQAITIDLKVEGTTLSGTVTEGALEARPIQAATLEGNNLSFRTTRNLGGSDINVNWKGELKGEDLALSREIGPAPAEAGGGRGGAGGGRGAAGGAAPAAGAGAGGRGGQGAGGRGGQGGAPAAGGRGAAPAGDAAAAAPPIPPVPAGQDGAAQAVGGRGGQAGGGRGAAGGGGRGAQGAAPAAGGGAGGGGGRGGGAAAAPAGPTVQLTLHRAK